MAGKLFGKKREKAKRKEQSIKKAKQQLKNNRKEKDQGKKEAMLTFKRKLDEVREKILTGAAQKPAALRLTETYQDAGQKVEAEITFL